MRFYQQLFREQDLFLWEMWISFRPWDGKCVKRYHTLRKISRSDAYKDFRQAGESDIVVNAHKINAGEPVTIDNKSRIFLLKTPGCEYDH